MSERFRNCVGISLTVLCVSLCLMPLFRHDSSVHQRFASLDQKSELTEISVWQEGIVAVNTADEDELRMLPGIGETLATLIIIERNNHGMFFYPEDLTAVRGIGAQKVRQMLPWLDLRSGRDGDQ